MITYKKAECVRPSLKLALQGPPGCGKTYSSLLLARGLVGPEGRLAVLDTENGSAALYGSLTPFDHAVIRPRQGGFDHRDFAEGLRRAEQEGYHALIVDSGSHLWQGILDDKARRDRRSRNSYANWAESIRSFNETLQSFLRSPMHILFCFRTKTEYVLEEIRTESGDFSRRLRRFGLEPVMREGIEYEFTTVFELGEDHTCEATKDRTKRFSGRATSGDRRFTITLETGRSLADWLVSLKTPQRATKRQRTNWIERIKQGVRHPGHPEGVMSLDDYLAFCADRGATRASELDDDSLRELARHVSRD